MVQPHFLWEIHSNASPPPQGRISPQYPRDAMGEGTPGGHRISPTPRPPSLCLYPRPKPSLAAPDREPGAEHPHPELCRGAISPPGTERASIPLGALLSQGKPALYPDQLLQHDPPECCTACTRRLMENTCPWVSLLIAPAPARGAGGGRALPRRCQGMIEKLGLAVGNPPLRGTTCFHSPTR